MGWPGARYRESSREAENIIFMGSNYNYRLTVEEKGLTGSIAVEGKVSRT